MSQQWWNDDDQLLAALGEALRSERSVPADFIQAGKAAFLWRGIDAEPATLTSDSARSRTGRSAPEKFGGQCAADG